LFVVDRRARSLRRVEDLTTRDALILGVAQAVALSPGVSRSGVTITAGRALGLTREAAVRFSFLMSLPIIGGAGLYKSAKLVRTGLPAGTATPFLLGMVASAVTGYVAVMVLLRLVRTRSFDLFVAYRVLLALTIFGVIASGLRPAGG